MQEWNQRAAIKCNLEKYAVYKANDRKVIHCLQHGSHLARL